MVQIQQGTLVRSWGEFYNQDSGIYDSKYEAVISGQQAGDDVSYEASRGIHSIAGNYTVTSATGHPILVVAAEDYSGQTPPTRIRLSQIICSITPLP